VRAPIFLLKVIRRELINAIRKKRPEMLANLENIYLHQDNAPAHTAFATSLELWNVIGFNRIAHPPYSPDLAPIDFSVFPAKKSELRGIRFEDLVELRSRVMSIIATFKSDWYRNVFAKLVTRHEKCVRCEDFEKEKKLTFLRWR